VRIPALSFRSRPGTQAQRVFLEVTLANGRTCRIEIDIATIASARRVSTRLAARPLSTRPSRTDTATLSVEQGHPGHLAKRAFTDCCARVGETCLRFRARAQPVRQLCIDALLEVLGSARSRPMSLIIDHNWVRHESLSRNSGSDGKRISGGVVVLLHYDFHQLRYFLRYVTRERDESVGMDSLEVLRSLAAAVQFDDLFLNRRFVAIPRPLLVTYLSLQFTRLTGAKLTVGVHDYFSICPSWEPPG